MTDDPTPPRPEDQPDDLDGEPVATEPAEPEGTAATGRPFSGPVPSIEDPEAEVRP